MGGYENAPATRLLATHCALCSRPLVDARSVEQGVGPVCAEKVGLQDIKASIREEANQIVQTVALAVSHERDGAARRVLLEGAVKALRGLGLVALAKKVADAQLGGAFGQVEVRVVQAEVELQQLLPGFKPAPVVREFLRLKTPYDAEFIKEVKTLRGARWIKEDKEWSVPVERRAEVWVLLQEYYAGLPGKGPKGEFTC